MKRIITCLLVILSSLDCFGQAGLGVTNRFAFPAIGGVRLREANITNGTNDSGNSALYGVPASFYDQDFYWNTTNGPFGNAVMAPSGNEWTQWIVPQVLAAKAAGANCVRLMWDATAFVGDSSHHGAASWLGTNTYTGLTNEIGMLATLCESNGMYLYATCTESRPLDVAVTPTNMIYTYISNFCAAAVLYPNVPAIDVVQEFDGTSSSTNGVVGTNANLWIAAAKAGMSASGRTVPVTCSLNGVASAAGLNLVNRWAAYSLAAAGVNYLDVHVYYTSYIADIMQAVTNRWNLPVVFGETGINISGVWGSGPDNESVHPYSSEIRQDFFFTSAQSSAELPYFQLEGLWAIAPNWLTNEEDFGLYSGQQSATYAFTNSRDQLRNFEMYPTNVSAPNYYWSLVSTGVNNSVLNYSTATRYTVGGGMLDVSPNPLNSGHTSWVRNNNMALFLGETNSSYAIAQGTGILWQTALPPASGEYLQFDIPPQTPAAYGSYTTWGAFLRGMNNGNGYIVQLTSDTNHTYDNKVDVMSYVSGTATDLTNITYGTALDLTKWWRFTVNVSTNVSPTTITCTVSNMTSGTVMSPSLVISDSTASLQSAGGMALLGYFGQPYYTNVNFKTIFDTAPTIAVPPSSTSSGSTVALSWNAATGGTGTINYTPQYVVTDWSTNFPSVSSWTSGTNTTSTSETLTGVPIGTNVILRVMSVDAASATNYSAWQITNTGSLFIPIYAPFRAY